MASCGRRSRSGWAECTWSSGRACGSCRTKCAASEPPPTRGLRLSRSRCADSSPVGRAEADVSSTSENELEEDEMSSAPYAPSYRPAKGSPEGPSPLFAVASVLLGLLVVVLAFVAVFMWVDAHQARDDANRAAAKATAASGGQTQAMPGMNMSLGDLTSYAGAAP